MKQHFVPRAYLKHFSSKKGSGHFVNSFDKQNGKHITTNINNICAKTNLYTLNANTKASDDILAIEKIYANTVEPQYLKAYKLLTDDTIFQISDSQRIEIVVGILQLDMRNPRHLKLGAAYHTSEISKQYREAINSGKKELTYLENKYNLEEWNEEDILLDYHKKANHYFKEQHLAVTAKICEIHEFIKIEVNKIIDHSQFMTSDNPLISDDIVTGYDNAFLRSQEFYLTLNKKYAVRLYHDNTKQLNCIYRLNVTDKYVHGHNRHIYIAASRFVIGDVESFTEYDKLEELFNSTSLELKMGLVEEILEMVSEPKQDEGYFMLKRLYEKYQQHGHLTFEEEYETIQRCSRFIRNKRIEKQQ